jgi:tetratricopeptide (TPR) repeat protein
VNNVPAAIAVLDEGLKLLPDSPGLWRVRGSLQFNAGNLDAARSSMLRTIQVSERFTHAPNEPSDVKYGRASAAFILGAIEMEKGNAIEADPWLRMAISIQPDNPEYLNAMVSNLRRLGREGEAQKYESEIYPRSNTSSANN